MPPDGFAPAGPPQAADPSPEQLLAALNGAPPVEQPAAPSPAQPEAEPEPEPEVTMTVRPMETMSAIDMIMGADEDRDESLEGGTAPDTGDGREQPEPQ